MNIESKERANKFKKYLPITTEADRADMMEYLANTYEEFNKIGDAVPALMDELEQEERHPEHDEMQLIAYFDDMLCAALESIWLAKHFRHISEQVAEQFDALIRQHTEGNCGN